MEWGVRNLCCTGFITSLPFKEGIWCRPCLASVNLFAVTPSLAYIQQFPSPQSYFLSVVSCATTQEPTISFTLNQNVHATNISLRPLVELWKLCATLAKIQTLQNCVNFGKASNLIDNNKKNKLSRDGKDVLNIDHTEPLNHVGMCRTYIIRVGFHYQLLKVAHWEPRSLLPNKALLGSLFSECQVCRVNALQWLIVLPSARQSSIPLSHGLRVLSDLIGSSEWTNRTVSNLWKSTWQILPIH